MNAPLRIRRVDIYPLAIPMRLRFEHAAAARNTADPVVVALTAEAPYGLHVGYGETLARRYVTGETAETVVEDIRTELAPRLLDLRAESFAEVVEFARCLPVLLEGRLANAARCAVELALLDLGCRVFRRRLPEVVGWLDMPGFGPPGCLRNVRYSGVVVGRSERKLARILRLQRCYGLRDFKIKVALPGWEARLGQAYRRLERGLASGRLTLRADANGGWTAAQAREALPLLERCGVSALEQPLPTDRDDQLPALAARMHCDLIADESLLTPADAEELLRGGAVRVFNVRLAKNGGLLPALEIARRVLAAGRDVQLGCLVGETSILAAAGVAVLETLPTVRFVEGAFGRFLLRGDVVRRPVQFGPGGRRRRLRGWGLGVEVDQAALRRWTVREVEPIRF